MREKRPQNIFNIFSLRARTCPAAAVTSGTAAPPRSRIAIRSAARPTALPAARPAALISLALVFLFIAVPAAFSARADSASNRADGQSAKVVFDKKVHDFGPIKDGAVVEARFEFRNEGDAPLVIERVDTSCGCTAAVLSERNIAPGKKGVLKATFDSRGYQGPVTKYIFVTTNDPQAPRAELQIKADVRGEPGPKIELDNYNLDLGLSLEGEEPTASVLISNTGQKDLRIEITHPEIRFFADGKPVTFPLFIRPGKERRIEFRFTPQARTGPLRDYVLIKSNDQVRATLSVYVSRYVLTRKELKELFERYKKVLEEIK